MPENVDLFRLVGLWERGFDTQQIANRMKVKEHRIYNTLQKFGGMRAIRREYG